MTKLPKKIFVAYGEEGTSEQFLNANKDMEEVVLLGEPLEVGVYELKEVRKVRFELKDVI